jgi:hypothetical protein
MSKKYTVLILTLAFSIFVAGCSSSGVGSYRERGHGGEVISGNDACGGGCLEYAKNGGNCVRFQEGISQVCKNYLNGLE